MRLQICSDVKECDAVNQVSAEKYQAMIDKIVAEHKVPASVVNAKFNEFDYKFLKFFIYDKELHWNDMVEVFTLFVTFYQILFSKACQKEKKLSRSEELSECLIEMDSHLISRRLENIFTYAFQVWGRDKVKLMEWIMVLTFCHLDQNLEKLSENYNLLLKKYFPNRDDLHLALTLSRDMFKHPEADLFIGLMVKRENTVYGKYRDHESEYLPLAVCGVRGLDSEVAILENIQGEKGEVELLNLKRWEFLLVEAMEVLVKELGVKTLVFRAAENHLYLNKARICPGDLHRRMNGTAKRLHYKKHFTADAKPYYVKSLVDDAVALPSNFELPYFRSRS